MRSSACLAALSGLLVVATPLGAGCGDGDSTPTDPDGSLDDGGPGDGGYVGCETAADCDDDNACNGDESCDATGTCRAGTPLEDGASCTTASNEDGLCVGGLCAPASCGDGEVNGQEQCDDGQDGDNQDGCRDDCTFTCEEPADCDDGEVCNGSETCDTSSHTCQPGTPLEEGASCGADMICSDGVCVSDPCGNGVVETGERCDDGNGIDDDICANDCTLNDLPDGDPITAMDDTWEYVPIDGAVCRDGSDTGIMVNLNSASDKVMIYLEGGGACFNLASCFLNPASFNPTGFERSSGIFDRDNMDNPVADWNFIYVPYCTGDVHSGDAETTVAGSLQQYRGYRNLELALERIVPTFPGATQVLLTGISAGGFGAAANAEQVQRDFGDVPVVLFDDSGPPMSSEYIAPCLQQQWSDTWGFQDTILRDCGADCPEPDDYVLDLAAHLTKRYPDNVGALFSNTEDGTIRTFYGFGDPETNMCSASPTQMDGAMFEMGLEDFRTFIQGETDNFGTYYLEGTSHTCIDDACFYDTEVEMEPLTDFLADLLAGSTSHVGP